MALDILREPIPRIRYALMHFTLMNGDASSLPYWARKMLGVLYHSIRASTQYAPMYFKLMKNGDARGLRYFT